MRRRAAALVCACVLLTGCTSFLERTYSSVEPHASKFWESEAAGTLRAENYQDIVNDLLILIGQHTERAVIRLYNFSDDMTVSETLERATFEIQQETPMGAYAVEYITSSSQAQRGYYEISVEISYRRTAKQIQQVVGATSADALYSLLSSAVETGKTELAVRIGYWGADSAAQVEETVARVREENGLQEAPAWTVLCYPNEENVELIEFLLTAGEEN